MEAPFDYRDIICDMRMTVDDWGRGHHHAAKATRRIYDADGTYAKRGDVGEVCDALPDEVRVGVGYVVVDFEATGPILCSPEEIAPA
jgi:hypothetical protein